MRNVTIYKQMNLSKPVKPTDKAAGIDWWTHFVPSSARVLASIAVRDRPLTFPWTLTYRSFAMYRQLD